MKEFDKIVEKASEFPRLDDRFSALNIYVGNLEEFINVTCDQTEIRLKARTNKEKDPVTQGEMESEIDYMQASGRDEFLMTICGSVLVSVYFTYEASLIDIFNHLAATKALTSFEKHSKTFTKKMQSQNKSKPSFLITAEVYAKEKLKICLFPDHSSANVIEELRKLRISYVHNGCTLDSLNDKTKTKIIDGTYGRILRCNDTHWHATPMGVAMYFKATYEAYSHFRRQAFRAAIT